MTMPQHHLTHHPSPSSPRPPQPHVAPHTLRLAPPPDPPKHNKTTTLNLSRRDLAVATSSSLPLLLWGALPATPRAHAETPPAPNCTEAAVGKKAFLDVSINGAPAGRVTVGLYDADAPAGAERFLGLVTGSAGVSYRRKEFVKIMPNYVQHGGVRSYGVDVELARSRVGAELAAEGALAGEWERAREGCKGKKKVRSVKGAVGIVVRDPLKPPPRAKLVARKGRLEVDEEENGKDPNGTEFVIVAGDAPELDESVLVVGRVLEGMEVVQRMLEVKTVQENTASPYFRVAKLIGDKRAVVAERGFNRPYSKVVVTNCGLLE